MGNNFEAFEIIIQRPNKKLTVRKAKCPFCKSDKHNSLGSRTTLLGIDSMNHKWHKRKCNDCGKEYTVEEKNKNVWITDNEANVLEGMPSCFEFYAYDCKCGGKVKRYITDLNGNKTNLVTKKSDENGKWINQYKTFYKCDKCSAKVQTTNDYYHSS